MMHFFGTVKTGGAFEVKGKDGSVKHLISFTSVDALGNALSCQMWPDDPQHAQLLSAIPSARRQRIQFEIVGYTVRLRKFQDGSERPQANFIVSTVSFPGGEQGNTPAGLYFTGTVKSGTAFDIKTKNGPSKLLSLTAIDELGNSWPCQMWPDDPQQEQLVSVVGSLRRQPV